MEISSLSTQGVNYSAAAASNAKTDLVNKVSSSKESSEAEKLKVFKQEVWREIDSMPYRKGMNLSVEITDEAFKRMMKEPKFKNEMIDVLREDAIASNKSMASTTLTRIDESGYSGYSYCQGGESAFAAHSSDKDSFYSKKAAKKHKAELEKRELERMYQQKMIDKQYYEKTSDKKLQFEQNYVSNQYGKNAGFILDNR